MKHDVIIIGGGIVGLSTAFSLCESQPGIRVLVLEKEKQIAAHQTGHNSGVIHTGAYYKPGSLKAKLTVEGSRSITEFSRQHGVRYEICGKVIVATKAAEVPSLDALLERGRLNGVRVERIDRDRLRELEPHVYGVAALYVPDAGIVDYPGVALALAKEVEASGGEIKVGEEAIRIQARNGAISVDTPSCSQSGRFLVNCAGLQSDRIAALQGLRPGVRIVPFKGEYYNLRPEKRYLVRNLIYPVPDPNFPFLGVHFTRMINGEIHAGPNAVLALDREAYRKLGFNTRDARDIFSYPGFWNLVSKHWRAGASEIIRSANRRAFVRSLRSLVPQILSNDIVPATPGIRAQAITPDGKLCDDFIMLDGPNSIHVVNAPSPAATASLEIGKLISKRVLNSLAA